MRAFLVVEMDLTDQEQLAKVVAVIHGRLTEGLTADQYGVTKVTACTADAADRIAAALRATWRT